MEDEDFGFTRRTDNVLKNVFTVGNEKSDDKGMICKGEKLICSLPKVGFLFPFRA